MPEDTQTQDTQEPIEVLIGDTLTPTACLQLETGIKFRQDRLEQIQKSENLYFNKKEKTLNASRYNIPLPIMSGFVDTIVAKIDDEPVINYDPTEESDIIRARKVSAAWEYESAPTRGMWAIKDLLVKKLAMFSGRGIYKIFAESDPEYQSYLEIVDAFDFVAEPNGGWHLENHLFCGQENIFRTESDLDKGVAAGRYNKDQVAKLKTATSGDVYKINRDLYQNKTRRFQAFGLNTSNNNYVGSTLYSLVEWVMVHNGERYYLVFEPISKIWIRCENLKDVFGKDKLPWVSWATHYDAWNFWSKAPCDDIRPIAEALKLIVNSMFDDVQKRLWGQKFFDPEMVPYPHQLEYDRPDKLVQINSVGGRPISSGVFEVPTGDNSSIVINLVDYFRGFLETESGVTDQTKGNSDQKILGIAQINEGQVADRMGHMNKFYVQAQAELGDRFYDGLVLCMKEKMLVKMIGEDGVEWDELVAQDLKFTRHPDVRISGGQTELRKNLEMQTQKEAALVKVIQFAPELINKKQAVESLLINSQWKADNISTLMDVSSDGNEEESVRASQAIQDILLGKKVEPYLGATTLFSKKIIDFARKKKLKPEIRIRLMDYALAHRQIIIENMTDVLNEQASAPVADPAALPPKSSIAATPSLPVVS